MLVIVLMGGRKQKQKTSKAICKALSSIAIFSSQCNAGNRKKMLFINSSILLEHCSPMRYAAPRAVCVHVLGGETKQRNNSLSDTKYIAHFIIKAGAGPAFIIFVIRPT